MKTLLLVEDNADNADLVCDLVSAEYEINWVADPAEALSMLRDERNPLPDLMLLDISLPGMDGTTLLREIRRIERCRRIPAVALTAHAMKNERDTFLSAGFDAYLSKPITDEEALFRTIREQIERAGHA